MGFWNKLGKIALTAAPYIAAPFTGGLSLAATGLTNKAVQKWSEKDANKRIAQGLAPSSFDKVLGKVGNYAAMGSAFLPTGALGSVGALSKAVGGASKAANIATKVGKGASSVLGGSYTGSPSSVKTPDFNPNMSKSPTRGIDWGGLSTSIGSQVAGDIMARRSNSSGSSSGNTATPKGLAPSSTAAFSTGSAQPRGANTFPGAARYQQGMDLNNPNLALSIGAGRAAGVRDQGFRRGYDVTTTYGEPNEETGLYETRVSRMPKIQSDFGRPQRDMGSLIGGSRKRKKNEQVAS